MTPSLVIATASVLIQRGLKALLGELPGGTGLLHCAVASTPEEAAAALRAHRPKVVIADPQWLPALGGSLRSGYTERLFLLSSRAHLGALRPMADVHACGFCSEKAAPRHLKVTIGMVVGCGARFGEGYCSSCPLRSTLDPPALPLSERELYVFQAIARGETTSDIAEVLGLSVKTIETYREGIKRKLGLNSGGELLGAAVRWKQGELLPSQGERNDAPAAESRRPRRP